MLDQVNLSITRYNDKRVFLLFFPNPLSCQLLAFGFFVALLNWAILLGSIIFNWKFNCLGEDGYNSFVGILPGVYPHSLPVLFMDVIWIHWVSTANSMQFSYWVNCERGYEIELVSQIPRDLKSSEFLNFNALSIVKWHPVAQLSWNSKHLIFSESSNISGIKGCEYINSTYLRWFTLQGGFNAIIVELDLPRSPEHHCII
jgi:hypothetical protein